VGGTEENQLKFSYDSEYPGRYLSLGLLRKKTKILTDLPTHLAIATLVQMF
jgi:hypothetical protein